MGWHNILMSRLEPLCENKHIPPPPGEGHLMLTGGTANFRAMAWATEYLRVTRYPNELPKWIKPIDGKKYIDSWRTQALYFFNEQKRSGFMTLGSAIEQFCPDPHTTFWVAAVVAFRRAAKEAGHADIYELSGQWFRSLVSVYLETMTPEYLPVMACARTEEGQPVSEVGMLIMQTLFKYPYQSIFKKPLVWEQDSYVGAKLFKKLYDEGDTFSDADKATRKDFPKLALPITIKRFKGGHITYFENTDKIFYLKDRCSKWTMTIYKGFRKNDINFSLDWKTEPPIVKTITEDVHIG